MTAYMLARINVTDPAQYENYKALAPIAINKYGGTYLTRGGAMETLEGNEETLRVVLFKRRTSKRSSSKLSVRETIAFEQPSLSAAAVMPLFSATATKVCIALSMSIFLPLQTIIRSFQHYQRYIEQ